MIHLYTGDGKGKTTAALGLLLRAWGRGKRCVLAQFLKGRETGELRALESLGGLRVLRQSGDFGFFKFASPEAREEIRRQNDANLREACRLADGGLCDLLVLDEICAAYRYDAVDTLLADKLISGTPPGLELVLTGRNAPPRFLEAADYITEMLKRRHPYDGGTAAREGIEF